MSFMRIMLSLCMIFNIPMAANLSILMFFDFIYVFDAFFLDVCGCLNINYIPLNFIIALNVALND